MTPASRPLIIGSRGSDLALWQAHHVQGLLNSRFPELEVTISIIHTSGDKNLVQSLAVIGGQGAFTKELEVKLRDGEIDLAVHSLKDLPTTTDSTLQLTATPARADVEDVFLSRDRTTPMLELPNGATVATGSLRRKAQLLALRPDLEIVDIRGNVPTRIRKLYESEWHGMILARAGITRLGLAEHITHPIPVEWILPAVGQGALGLQTRAEDEYINGFIAALNDPATHAAVLAERAVLRAMGGGCQVPIGAYGKVIDETLELRALIVHPHGRSVIRGERTGRPADAEMIGSELAESLLNEGGRALLEIIP